MRTKEISRRNLGAALLGGIGAAALPLSSIQPALAAGPNFLWAPGTSNNGEIASSLTLMTTELESLTSANGIVSSVNGASGVFTNANTAQAIWADIFFNVGNPAFTATAGANLSGWFLTSADGTTFETPSTTTYPGRAPDFIIPIAPVVVGVGTLWKSQGLVLLPPSKFKVWVANNTGVTLGSGATTVPSLLAALYAMQY